MWKGSGRVSKSPYAELLLSGVTTLADLSHPFPGWLDLAARSGMRIYLAPWYASAVWHLENRHELKYRWDEAAGRRAFDDALRLIDEADAHPCGRLSGMIAPAQIDTCTEDLLRDSLAAAHERSRPFTTHASQSVVEFETMVRRHGKTPIQWAHEIGLLGESHDSRSCHLHRSAFVVALGHPRRLESARRDRRPPSPTAPRLSRATARCSSTSAATHAPA